MKSRTTICTLALSAELAACGSGSADDYVTAADAGSEGREKILKVLTPLIGQATTRSQMMSANAGDVLLGQVPMKLAPRYAGFEGVGGVDNFVIRKLTGAVQ